MRRTKSNRHVCTGALGRRSTLIGMTSIALQPLSVRAATAVHGGAKRADSVDRWYRVPRGVVMKKYTCPPLPLGSIPIPAKSSSPKPTSFALCVAVTDAPVCFKRIPT